ncbi:hypothetical protein F3Y22_tig00116973pilonHSYRG00007 [Hibiscus syriacus]|uniref:Uncharacterized protein n=1 Tax=Hibiscus syriacus TaxID=106335 RepID=A0A6A2XPA3_HIBSY|nr:hypothetical protein F3Y22_tig00116973pilonHSYRG00007 [Hibiscus syriacus]
MARQMVVLALILIALVGLVSAAAPASASKSTSSPAAAPAGAPADSTASSPPSQASAPAHSSCPTIEVSTMAGVGAAVVATHFMF